MPRVRAASSALRRSREAIAVTSLHAPFCIPGMTFVTAILAVLRIPQRTLLDISRHHSRKGCGRKNQHGLFPIKPTIRDELRARQLGLAGLLQRGKPSSNHLTM